MKKEKILKNLVALTLAASLLAGCGAAGDSAGVNTGDSAGADTNGSASTNENADKAIEEIEVMTFEMPSGATEADIFVKAIDGISDDFIRGVDVSSVLAEEKSGVVYYNEAGEAQDIFMSLAEAGVNYVRLRVWNDPYDENGKGYGGGNNDLATAIELGKRASKYGMKVSIDFHYSDFWADPKRQHAPKAWEGMSIEEKSDALYTYTKDSLKELLDAGVNVTMVQVGNEINNAMSGEDFKPNIYKLLRSGSKAVREISEEYNRDINIVIHYTNISTDKEVHNLVSGLNGADIDYDTVGLSYYPYWHGDNENMKAVVKDIQDNYGKQVLIAETSYGYTSEEGDGTGNSFAGTDDAVEGYPVSVQGQANIIRDICAAANEVNALGVFYWEPAWIPVGPATADNSAKWEEFGSGWASSYASDYDPEDAGLYYGGSSWDNQAMFDFTGHPLPSLNVWKYLKYGATTDLKVDAVPDVTLNFSVTDEITLPEEVDVLYNDGSGKKETVSWNEEDLNKIDKSSGGSFDVRGSLDDGSEVTAHIKIDMVNLIDNSSFEEADLSMWNMTYESNSNPTDIQDKADDAHTGSKAYHWWSESDMEFGLSQELTDLPAGTYSLSLFAQGGDVDDSASMELYVDINGKETSQEFMVAGWANWQNPEIADIKLNEGDKVKVGVRVKMNPKSWGTIDDISLNKVGN